MATKKECDRCGKQWRLDEREETCAIAVDAPYWENRLAAMDRKKVAKTYELCQSCTRGAVMYLEHKDTIVQSA